MEKIVLEIEIEIQIRFFPDIKAVTENTNKWQRILAFLQYLLYFNVFPLYFDF